MFTGLTADRQNGRVSVSRKRLWRLRLAIDHALEANRMMGGQVRRIVGRITWRTVLRRTAAPEEARTGPGEREVALRGGGLHETRWSMTWSWGKRASSQSWPRASRPGSSRRMAPEAA